MQNCLNMLIDERLTVFLLLLKISPNLLGHDFFKEGAKKIIKDNDKKFNVGVGLYKEIASDNGVKQDLVDRAMRHAIDVSFRRNGISDFEKTCNINLSITKPSSKELLCVLAEMALMESNRILRTKRTVW